MRALLFSITSLILSTNVVPAQELENILEAHFKAAASEKMKKVETIITHGKNINSIAGIETSFTIYQARPDKIRIESEYRGSQVLQTFNGESGWIYAPMMGITVPAEMKGNELETLLTQAEFEDPLWKSREKGNRLELIGKNVEGTAYQIRITTSKAEIRNFFISSQTHQISSYKTIQLMGGSETEIEVILEDYKEVKEIPFPHKLISKMNGQVVGTILIDNVEINREIDPAKFEKPYIE